MPNQVAILHGWSDTSKSFRELVAFLRGNGFEAVPLWLGDYVSMDDDVRIEDVAKRMDQVVREKVASGELIVPFDLIVHSTGGLVARQWLAAYYPEGITAPIKRLVMLAPANFGSRLASMGQSLLGRVVKGWNNWFHTGKQVLQALELASPFQWDLAQRDIFIPEGTRSRLSPLGSQYGPVGVWPFVLIGSHPYPGTLKRVLNEDGGDGTVRVAAANLNARGITVDFSQGELDPVRTEWGLRHGTLTFPLAVLPDRSHDSITDPGGGDVRTAREAHGRLGSVLLQALRCPDPAAYVAMASEWALISEATAALGSDAAARDGLLPGNPDAKWFNQYFQVIVRVEDDHGAVVDDYFLEFFGPDATGTEETIFFQREVLTHVHVNRERPSHRCLYVDRTDLVGRYYQLIPAGRRRELAMSISINPPGDNIRYFERTARGAKGHVVVHREDATALEGRWLRRNSTHFVRIIVPRNPQPNVFRLSRAPVQ